MFSYNAEGQVATRHTYTHATGGTTVAAALNTTIQYTRDLRGAPTFTLLTVGSQTFRHWYDYDARGLLWKTFTSTGSGKPGTPDLTYAYGPDGQVSVRQFAAHVPAVLRYTIRGQLAMIGHPFNPSGLPFTEQYDYFANGTVERATSRNTAVTAMSGPIKYEFTYDAINRMTAANYSYYTSSWVSTAANDENTLAYDKSGNLTSLRRYASNGSQVDHLTYTYGSGTNRLTSVADAQSTTSETWDVEDGSFTYYADGNLKTAPAPYSITAASYNRLNLPDSVTAGGTTSTYRYNEAGHRIAKKVGSGNVEYYILDGATTLGVFTLDGSGTAVSWHFNVIAGGVPLGRHMSSGTKVYYHTDMLGSVRAVVTSAGANAEGYTYYPYGLLNEGLSANFGATKEGFTGKERDAETGLSYFGARYYMPALGRWGAVDPLADQFPGWSGYNYTLNNPAGMVDPDGLSPCDSGESTTECIGKFWEAETQGDLAQQRDMDPINFSEPLGLCTPWPECVSGFWDEAAVQGHTQGGVSGTLKAAGASLLGAFYDFAGIDQAALGVDEYLAGNEGYGVLLVGLSVGGNLPGGQSGKVIFSGKKVTNTLANTLGIDRRALGRSIESIKRAAGLRGADNIQIDEFGNVMRRGDEAREILGNVFDEFGNR
jgi:RHS repeat-associated protein